MKRYNLEKTTGGFKTIDRIRCDNCNGHDNHFFEITVRDCVDDREIMFYTCFNCNIKLFLLELYCEFAVEKGVKLKLVTIIDRNTKKTNHKREPVSLGLRYKVLKKHNFKCNSCGISASECQIEIDHINPVCNGGKGNIENLQPLCFECNRGKGGKVYE